MNLCFLKNNGHESHENYFTNGSNLLFEFTMCFACTISFNPDNNLMEGYYYPHFMDGGTETQRHNFPRATL